MMSPSKPPALIIFDCDGVLVDSEPITNGLMAREMTEAGLPLSTEEAMALFVGGTIKSVFTQARNLGARLPDDWVAAFYDRMCATLEEEVEAIPGIHAVLDRIATAELATCIASNGPMRKMAVTLGRTGLLNRFGGMDSGRVFSAHDVGIAKPEPGLFLHAARAHGADPSDCVVIEDSGSGAQAAAAAGMRCFGFTRETPAAKLTAHGAQPFDKMTDLPGLLGLA